MIRETCLDERCEQLRAGAAIACTLDALIRDLDALRSTMSHDEWRLFARKAASRPPVRDVLHQDPFTHRSFQKPRGYAGDAVMIDYVYGYAKLNGTSSLGRAVMECTTNTATAKAVRCRREIFARSVDETAARRPLPRILALACGHLREAYLSTAVCDRRIGEYIALDQDPESLAVVDQTFGRQGVRIVRASVLDLPTSDLAHAPRGAGGGFDAAGLYDYLWQGAAKELTACAFNMLDPGGRLVIANVMPSIPDAGYMEAIMDWWLIYRTADQLAAVADSIPGDIVASHRTFTDPTNCIVFLELTRV
jgi:extracellular factor (EF) 3-hydroxypalmitic acid methyl ester biosynthesis protein